MTVRVRDLLLGFRELGLGKAPVVVHASLSSFGDVDGGAANVAYALGTVFQTVIAPAFTYKTLITPPVGPPGNGIQYGSSLDQNRMAEFFKMGMPVDSLIGAIPEALRHHPRARRSHHPIQSFTGINAEEILAAQTMEEPLAPLDRLEKSGGWVVLMGVDHTVNTSIHCAEKKAGRKTFIRWALTPAGVVECPNFPGCSAGFAAITPDMAKYTRKVSIGNALVQALPLSMLFRVVATLIQHDPLALLCGQEDCERCTAVREDVSRRSGNLK